MGLRDLVLTLLVAITLPFILRRPYIGILVWSWLSYMNPHKQAFGFAYNMPFAQIVAITTLVSILFSREKFRFPMNGTIVLWLMLLLWMTITTAFAIYPEIAWEQYTKVIKIQLVTFLTLLLIVDFKKLNQLIWVIALSIGFYSTKGGLFTIMTGGSFRVWGPGGGFIQENNSLAVATLMILPLIIYLYNEHKDVVWLKNGLLCAAILSAFSVVGSQSRGALIAVAAVGAFFWLKSKSKLLSGFAIVLLGFTVFSFMPSSWHDRMNTIENYQEDKSAMGRINAWGYSINVASDRFTGAGFESWSAQNFARWAPDPDAVHAAHSIYFSVLADHGWPGLALFLIILGLTWFRLSKLISHSSDYACLQSENFLARMLQISLIAYLVGGAFLSLSYFDLPWHIMAIAIILDNHVAEKLRNISSPDCDEISSIQSATQKRPL